MTTRNQESCSFKLRHELTLCTILDEIGLAFLQMVYYVYKMGNNEALVVECMVFAQKLQYFSKF